MTTTHYTGEERRKRIFAIVGASSGNLVEWFDFYVYAFCAIYFAPAFFPSDDPTFNCSTPRAYSPQAS
jgi:MHS family alpha-ketoglutarate permease-like MFS transporter